MDEVEVKIKFDPDDIDASDFTWGDMEDLQAGKFEVLRRMIEKYGIVEGIPEDVPESLQGAWLTNYLRGLKFGDMLAITNSFLEVINNKQNPVGGTNGKNSKSGSPHTSTPRRVGRR
jgi:hypothetical protein